MKKKDLLVLFFSLLAVTGVVLRIYAYHTGNVLLLIGTLCLFLHYLIRIIRSLKSRMFRPFTLCYQVIVVFMSVVIYGKYLYTAYGYYLGLAVIPVFIIATLYYWIRSREKALGLTMVSVVYMMLTIPSFFIFYDRYPTPEYFTFHYPQQYIAFSYIRLDNTIDLEDASKDSEPPLYFTLMTQAEQLADAEGRYEEAIELYNQMKTMTKDPNGYVYNRLSQCYYFSGQFKEAISALDTLIMLEPSRVEHYSLRGFCYYDLKEKEQALKDIEMSLTLDTTFSAVYILQLLVYLNLYGDSCKAYEAAQKLAYYDSKVAELYSDFMQEMEEKMKGKK